MSAPASHPSITAVPPRRIIAAFACVYFFWGSTYTAIHVAGLHLAPPLVAAARSILTTILLVLLCLFTGRSLRVSRRELWRLALVGILFMTCNNILLTWAETMVASGVASLLVSTMPIMVAVIEAALPDGEALNKRGWAGTLFGTAGMVALVWPSLHSGDSTTNHRPLAYVLLLLAALAFAVGAVLSRRFHFTRDPFVVTTWQIGTAALCNVILALAGGTLRTAVWTRGGLAALVYLSVFGSLVGLSCLTLPPAARRRDQGLDLRLCQSHRRGSARRRSPGRAPKLVGDPRHGHHRRRRRHGHLLARKTHGRDARRHATLTRRIAPLYCGAPAVFPFPIVSG